MSLDQRYPSDIPRQITLESQKYPSEAPNSHFPVDFASKLCYNHLRWFFIDGEMAERLMALVLKTSDAERHRGFESLSLRHFSSQKIK